MRGALLLVLALGCDSTVGTAGSPGEAGPPGPPGPRADGGPAADEGSPDVAVPDDAASVDPADAAPPDECPPWTPPPGLGGAVDAEVSVEMAARWLDYRRAREQERLWAAYDPAAVAQRYRIEQAWIDAGCVTVPQLVDLGRALFLRDFTEAEGYGNGHGPPSRFQRGLFGGPDASNCTNCHWKGGFAGAGDRVDNAFLFGDGERAATHDQRNPPVLWGAGWSERIGAEMTAELQAIAAEVERTGTPARLVAKGIDFGRLAPGDTSGVEGVDPDLVVKPFGWKGTFATIRRFAENSLHTHFGLQAESLLADPGGVDVGPDGGDDPDGDGITREITDGQLSALVAFVATLDPPRILVPDEGGARGPPLSGELDIVASPEFVMRWLEGAEFFGDLGCADCHVPFLPVSDARFRDGVLDIDLATHGAGPHPARRDDGTWLVPVFSDFKRHDMGESLASQHVDHGVPPATWLTRRLWGVAQSRPYLHDGSAVTFDEAIARHGGEAADARDAFLARPEAHRASLRVFLLSLRRAPAIRVR